MKRLVFTLVLAACLWTLMFSPWTAPHVPFWWVMAGSALMLGVLTALFNPGWWKQIKWTAGNVCLGIGAAVMLWGIFWAGDKVSSWLFDFARGQVDENIWNEERRISVAAHSPDAVSDRPC